MTFLTRTHSQIPDSFSPGADDIVDTTAQQGNGQILIGGGFNFVTGEQRTHVARVDVSGKLDTNFNPALVAFSVKCLAVQPDGKLLIGGSFYSVDEQPRQNLARINADGSLDGSFAPSWSGTNNSINCFALQADGKILVGGEFWMNQDGYNYQYLVRFNPNGSLDTNFTPWPTGRVLSIALQPDGKIVVGGSFNELGGEHRNYLGRVNPNGTLDTNFTATADGLVYSLAVQADGKILVGGSFGSLAGQSRLNIGRLNPDGTLDVIFNPGASNGTYSTINSMIIQSDGKILVGGYFTSLAGQTRTNLGRLNSDGKLDLSFDSVAIGWDGWIPEIASLALQADGKILVGGYFSTLGGQARTNIARLMNTTPGMQNLSIAGSAITWLRGGSFPEVWRTTFEVSTNGTNWVLLGEGTRTMGGWQLAGVYIPPNSAIRAHGFVVGGSGNGSTWFVETTRPALVGGEFQPGGFSFRLIGSPGQIVAVEASTDLINWTPQRTNTLTNGLGLFTDTNPGSFATRYYRARSL